MMEKGEVFQSGLADILGRPKASTPHADLLRQLFDSRIPKTEREHAAVREIERLTADNERLREELRQSGIDHTRAEVERLKAERDEAVRAEREACAKVCEQLVNPYAESVGSLRHATLACATAIRERGQEPPR